MNHQFSTSNAPTDTQAWYRQFWPWFLIALPATVVVAGLYTVFIAFQNADALVRDNYYRQGLAINQQLQQDQQASLLGMQAQIRFDDISGEVWVELSQHHNITLAKQTSIAQQAVTLLLIHPVDDKKDQRILLQEVAGGRYRADMVQRLRYSYYLRLVGVADSPIDQTESSAWRLNGKINFEDNQQITLIASVATPKDASVATPKDASGEGSQ